jgi:hypothetical protein
VKSTKVFGELTVIVKLVGAVVLPKKSHRTPTPKSEAERRSHA